MLNNFQSTIFAEDTDRISILNEDLLKISKEMQQEFHEKVDVVVMNNTFQFFLNKEQNHAAWKFVKDLFKSGTILVLSPSLTDSFSDEGIEKDELNLEEWVESLEVEDNLENDTGISFYRVK